MIDPAIAKKVNIFCLLIAIVVVLVLPLKKEIWYDESISILISKGINNDSKTLFANSTTISSATIEQLNTLPNVYKASVIDNGNSFLYNVCLHWFTGLFGNSIPVYMLLSKLSSIAALLAFFVLCRLFLKDSIFTSVAIVFLATDLNFIGMSHEIRAYAMGAFFITLAVVYLYRYLWENEKPLYLFFIGLFSVAAILCHFLSVYAVLVFLAYLVFVKKAKLLSLNNLIAIMIPVLLIATYFYFSFVGLKYMSNQNEAIAHKAAMEPFTLLHVVYRSMAMVAIDFKVVFASFTAKKTVGIASFLLVIVMYMMALKNANDKTEKRNLHLLFILGVAGSFFLALLCFKSHHYTAMYNRYHSFCIPFACLFTAYVLYVLFKKPGVNMAIKGGVLAITLLPCCALFVLFLRTSNPPLRYNHIALAKEITTDKVAKIEVPDWNDAFLIQSFLPQGYKIDYVLNKSSLYFTLYKANSTEQVLIISNNF